MQIQEKKRLTLDNQTQEACFSCLGIQLQRQRQANSAFHGVVVTDAIKLVNSKMEHLNTEQKKMLDVIQSESQEAETETSRKVKETDLDVGQPQSKASDVF
jgi:3-methyladenine DNA glycosylase AlkD